jgi:hypothetical protein
MVFYPLFRFAKAGLKELLAFVKSTLSSSQVKAPGFAWGYLLHPKVLKDSADRFPK